jgi:hypothetical protein
MRCDVCGDNDNDGPGPCTCGKFGKIVERETMRKLPKGAQVAWDNARQPKNQIDVHPCPTCGIPCKCQVILSGAEYRHYIVCPEHGSDYWTQTEVDGRNISAVIIDAN